VEEVQTVREGLFLNLKGDIIHRHDLFGGSLDPTDVGLKRPAKL
jgi:hypothetical protein